MKMIRTALAMVGMLLLATTVEAAHARTILAKIGGSYDRRAADRTLCETVAARAPVRDLPQAGVITFYGTSVATGVASLFGDLIAAGIRVDQMRGMAVDFCMRSLEYVPVPLTNEEEDTYDRLSSDGRDAWERSFLATDLTARIAPLIAPKVPPLPGYRAEPYTVGGIRIEPETLRQVNADVEDAGIVVLGKARRWRTAVLTTPISGGTDDFKFEIDAGTVLHQTDSRPQTEPLLRPATVTWCGPGRTFVRGYPTGVILCILSGPGGYAVYDTQGQAWFAGAPDNDSRTAIIPGPVRLEERASDDLGELGFELSISYTSIKYVHVTAKVLHDGRPVTLFVRELKYDGHGKAVLPLWGHKLTISFVSLSRAHVELTSDGDGRAWRGD